MDPFYDPDAIPWELIGADLQGALTVEERQRLDAWLSLSPAHGETYERIRALWEKDVEGYGWWRQADTAGDWAELLERLGPGQSGNGEPGGRRGTREGGVEGDRELGMRSGRGQRTAVRRMFRWGLVAAVLAGVVLAGIRYRNSRVVIYETAADMTRQVELSDGSFVTLKPQSSLRLDPGFDGRNRVVYLQKGGAYFEVLHREGRPFVVRTENSEVRDIATRFTVLKGADSILVSVLSGKVAFVNRSGGETRDLGEGMELVFHPATHRFDQIAYTGWIGDSSRNRLQFVNEPLSRITAVLESMSGKTIRLQDSILKDRRLTIHLDGETFEDAMRIICSSLDLTWSESHDTCTIKARP